MTEKRNDTFGQGAFGSEVVLDALEEAPMGLILVDRDERVRFASGFAVQARNEASPEQVIGLPFHEAFPEFSSPRLASTVSRKADGDYVWTPVSGGGWIGLFQFEEKGGHQSLSQTDDLTGLGNRAYLRTVAAQTFPLGPNDRPVLILLDMDRFKLVNDTMGHGAGDELLIKVAKRLRGAVRRSDRLIRLGGDEFIVILNGNVSDPDAEAVAARIIEFLSRPFLIDRREVQVGASAGLVRIDPDDIRLQDALRHADIALYASKHRGRSQYRWFHPEMEETLNLRKALESDLKRAILLDEFELLYQPQFNVQTGQVVGVEALVRWNHPERGPLLPSAFLPVAEETRLIDDLGEWILEDAVRTAASWPGDFPVSVNVAAAHFRKPSFAAQLEELLADYDLPPSRLEVEVSEGVFLSLDSELLAAVEAVKALGVRLVLDDFGTGMSGLSTLRTLDFDRVKIDSSFLTHPEMDPELFRVLAEMGNILGSEVTAEGVEDPDHVDRVRNSHASDMQGFLLSRPLSLSELHQLIDQNSGQAGEKTAHG